MHIFVKYIHTLINGNPKGAMLAIRNIVLGQLALQIYDLIKYIFQTIPPLWANFIIITYIHHDACDVTLSVYPHRASLKNMPDHGGNRTYDLWNTRSGIFFKLARCGYTLRVTSQFTSIIFTWVHYTNTEKSWLYTPVTVIYVFIPSIILSF
jgi:hypothetical protein